MPLNMIPPLPVHDVPGISQVHDADRMWSRCHGAGMSRSFGLFRFRFGCSPMGAPKSIPLVEPAIWSKS